MKQKPLTDNQRRVLNEIKLLGRPTFCEIAARIGRDQRAARQHIVALQKKGYVTHTPRKWRSIALTEQGLAFVRTLSELKAAA
jgi:DNA-binding MarR family transcriptional regulator